MTKRGAKSGKKPASKSNRSMKKFEEGHYFINHNLGPKLLKYHKPDYFQFLAICTYLVLVFALLIIPFAIHNLYLLPPSMIAIWALAKVLNEWEEYRNLVR